MFFYVIFCWTERATVTAQAEHLGGGKGGKEVGYGMEIKKKVDEDHWPRISLLL